MGARTTTSTMVGVSRITSFTTARSSLLRRAVNSEGGGSAGARVPSRRETTGYPCFALAMAFTTLPAKDGCRSPKKLMPRPSGRTDVSTRTALGLAIRSGCTGCPFSSTAWNQRPSSIMFSGSSRPSTVLGCVPAATRIDFAGRRTGSPESVILPVAASNDRRSRCNAAACPCRSTSTSWGDRHSLKRMPSSNAFQTSSWFSV